MEERWVPVDQAELFCRTLGKGQPLIVIHGGAGLSQDYLLPWLTRLAEHHFVIFYDQRGCGRSTGEISLESMMISKFVQDLDSVRAAFHADQVTLLGHSWGGFVAMHYAITHPESVDKLILSNALPSTSEGYALFLEEYGRRIAPYQREIDAIQQTPGFELGDPALHAQWLLTIFRTYVYDPEKADLLNFRMSRQACLNRPKAYEMSRKNTCEHPFDLNPALSNLHLSTLIIHGDCDPIPWTAAQLIHATIEESQLLLIPKCGHFPYIEEPDIYFDTIRDFL